jgi:hypothetical protein
MFFANEILLTTTATTTASQGYEYAQQIHFSSGYQILKPVRSIPGIAVISALLVLQMAALI